MKVVFYHRKPGLGHYSVERLFEDVRRHLPADVECDVATSRFESRGIFKRAYNVLEAAVRQGDINHITGDVHFLTYLLRKPRTVLTILDCGSLHRLKGVRREVFRHLWFQIPVRRVAAITVISQATKDDLLRLVNCDSQIVRVIHVPVSPSFRQITKEFNASKPSVLLVGTAANKNIERTAEALAGLSCHLHVVGKLSDSQREALGRFHIEYENSAKLTDAELVTAYEASDLLMFASTFEGFGMPIVEANVVGRPVVTSNVCSMPEVAGDAACLVDPLRPKSIRDGFLRVVGDPQYRRSLIEHGFGNAERFTPAAIATQYYRLYKEVLAGRHP